LSARRASPIPHAIAAGGPIAPSIPGLLDLWAETNGDPRIVIGVLDGPVDVQHPAFATAKLTVAALVASTVPDPAGAATRHATAVASLIFGGHHRSSPVAGIAPGCRGLIVPIFDDSTITEHNDRRSLPVCSQLDLARALLVAADHGVHIINVSAGEFIPAGVADPVLADAVAHCVHQGILIVAAAGNDGCECLHVPAVLDGVLAVGAMDEHGEPDKNSNWGPYDQKGLLVLGTDLVVANAGGGSLVVSGTSYAAAISSGIAGLLWSVASRFGRRPTGVHIREILLDSTVKCFDDALRCHRQLTGRLDLVKAREYARARENTMTDEFPMSQVSGLTMPAELKPLSLATDQSVASSVGDGPIASSGHQIVPSESCGCASCQAAAVTQPAGFVFALGEIGYDLVSEARRDSIQQHMEGNKPTPLDPAQLTSHLDKNPWEAASIVWTLSSDQTPLYALIPAGPFAAETYARLREFLADQLKGRVDRVSIPGRLSGRTRLFSGQMLPVIDPELRGMYSWTTDALLASLQSSPVGSTATATQSSANNQKVQAVRDFLERVYHELRNLGISSQDRAINYAATNAFQIQFVYESTLKDAMALDSVDVEKSTICRPGSDCWDVKLAFFYPERQVQTVRKMYRFTVDVSDIVPVTVGPVRSWFVR
jgi:subtilisin family serine protease